MLATLMLIAVVTPSASADEFAGWVTVSGVVVAVNQDDQTVLVDSPDGLHLFAVDPAADIQIEGVGTIDLASIRPGARVEVAADSWAGMTIATSLHLATALHAAKE